MDLTGTFIGQIEFLRRVGTQSKYALWECKCHKCGKTFTRTYQKIKHFYAHLPKGSDKSMKMCVNCLEMERRLSKQVKTDATARAVAPTPTKQPYSYANSSRTATCHMCGHEFGTFQFDMRDYAYKRNNHLFCSYHCYNKYCKLREEQADARRK